MHRVLLTAFVVCAVGCGSAPPVPETVRAKSQETMPVTARGGEPLDDCAGHRDGEACFVEFLARRAEGECQSGRCVVKGACVRACGVATSAEVADVLRAWEQEGQSWFARCDEPWQGTEVTDAICYSEVVAKWKTRIEDAAGTVGLCASDCLLGEEPPPVPPHPHLVQCTQDSECAREDECAVHRCYQRVCSRARRRDGESCTVPGPAGGQGSCLASACVPQDKLARECGAALGRRLTVRLWWSVVRSHNATCEEEVTRDLCLERKANAFQWLREDIETALMNCLLGYHDEAGDWYTPSLPWTMEPQLSPSSGKGQGASE
jgi:hypothetical protein